MTDRFRCICDPTVLFDPPNPTPRAVEGCPAHRARYFAQNLDYEKGKAQQVRMVEHGRNVLAGYDCPDHPGPLDDARNHICRMRPVQPEWACDECGYHNNVGICTHCGQLKPKETA